MGCGLYIHVPFCRSKCLYCDFVSFAGAEGRMGAYVRAVRAEMALAAGQWGPLSLDTVYFGGGTPSLLGPADVALLLEEAARRFDLRPDAEITLEMNPGTADRAALGAFRRCGVNRLSLGLQAAQPRLLKALSRSHTVEQFERAAAWARQEGFERLSADLMSGLPGQSEADIIASVELVGSLCGHVSLYTLHVEDGTPLGGMVRRGEVTLPDADAESALFHAAMGRLRQMGFGRYEISNFAKPGQACRHNLNYWMNGQYLGLGCAAASHIQGLRLRNTESLDAYLAAMARGEPCLAERVVQTEADEAYDTVMLALRTSRGLDRRAFQHRFGYDFAARRAARIAPLERAGLLVKTADRLWLTDRGMDVQNGILTQILPD